MAHINILKSLTNVLSYKPLKKEKEKAAINVLNREVFVLLISNSNQRPPRKPTDVDVTLAGSSQMFV